MPEITIEQALYRREGVEPPRLLARSPHFDDAWLGEAEDVIIGFGDPPPGARCPAAVYAHPLGKRHVAVVRVAQRDQPGLSYHMLVIAEEAYQKIFFGDPFKLAQRLPPPWDAPDPLPAVTLPTVPLPPRTVEEVQLILQRTKAAALRDDFDTASDVAQEQTVENALSPVLLGSAQILVDGGRVVFERPVPDPDLMQGLWTLLPTSTRCHLWPASFAYGNVLYFDAVVTPRIRAQDFPDYTREEQAAEYPEGRYERRLQTAAETGDQAELDSLFARRSGRETIRLGITILTILSLLVLGLKFFDQGPAPQQVPPEKTRQRVAVVVSLVGTPSALNRVVVLPVARDAWNRMGREAP
jgi:hypothetical protein